MPNRNWLLLNDTDSWSDLDGEIAFDKLKPPIRATSSLTLTDKLRPTLGVKYKPLNSSDSLRL